MADRKLILAGGVAALALLAAGGWWISHSAKSDRFAECRPGVVAPDIATLGGSFTLTDQNGARVTDKEVFAQPALLYFGYTYCPDVCPMDVARNAAAVDILREQGHDIRPVFISVDPKRDTPEVLHAFAGAIHPDMIGLTGSAEEIAAVSKDWRNYYRINDQHDPDNYLVDHATTSYLVLPGHGAVYFFRRDLTAEDLAGQTGCFLDRI